LFYWALIPGLISASLVLLFVREIRPQEKRQTGPPPIFQSFPKPFWALIVANSIFSLANSSDSFLLLRSSEIGMGFGAIVLAYALYNAVYAGGSIPFGDLSDRIGRKPVIAVGWIVYALVYGGFAIWHSPIAPWVLLAIYGLYQAHTDGVARAMVSDLVPAEQRGGAIGLFYMVSGFGQLLGSLLTGAIWNVRFANGAISAPFAVGAVLAIFGVIALIRVPNGK
jgi:MFS family permease